MKLTAKDLTAGQTVTVTETGAYSSHVIDQVPGTVVEVRRTKVDIRHALRGHERTETFAIATGVAELHYQGRVFFQTAEQMDDERRREAALAVLARHGLRPGTATDRPWIEPFTMDTAIVEQLAAVLIATEAGSEH